MPRSFTDIKVIFSHIVVMNYHSQQYYDSFFVSFADFNTVPDDHMKLQRLERSVANTVQVILFHDFLYNRWATGGDNYE